ncbi:MAG: deoxyribodipyrimidine photolyase, partial [Bacillariaceae sp.]
KKHVFSAYKDKSLDAPELICKLPCNFFLQQQLDKNDDDDDNNNDDNNDDNCCLGRILDLIPSKWKEENASCPGQRPWTVKELNEIDDCKKWAVAWEGADNTVLPCQQTNGSKHSAIRRWKYFINDESGGLKNYAKKRNQITNPHGVSRISCYLNLGILSIFDIIYDVWHIQSTRSGYTTGCNKYLEEIIKWREGSYVHVFASPEYHSQQVLPSWSCRYFESLFHTTKITTGNNTSSSSSSRGGYDYKQLETASTRDEIWNAMQSYLIDTGELHNNARMTW